MNEKITLTIASETLEDWEERAKKLNIPRNAFIHLMVTIGIRNFNEGTSIP